MDIKLYSQYTQFNDFANPKYIKWTKKPCKIEAYHDMFLTAAIDNKNNGKKKIALITEPRCVWHCFQNFNLESFILKNYNIFDYIFTFDDQLLQKLPNAKPMPFIGVWYTSELNKTKNISMCCSNKAMCQGHLNRKKIADLVKNKVDILGDYLGEARVNTKDIYSTYRYSIVLENEIDEYYFTEKVLNAFANKCIPIYYGSPKILKWFNKDGIIFIDDLDQIPYVLENLNPEEDYLNRKAAINENFEIVKKYKCYEDFLFQAYQNRLEDLWRY